MQCWEANKSCVVFTVNHSHGEHISYIMVYGDIKLTKKARNQRKARWHLFIHKLGEFGPPPPPPMPSLFESRVISVLGMCLFIISKLLCCEAQRLWVAVIWSVCRGGLLKHCHKVKQQGSFRQSFRICQLSEVWRPGGSPRACRQCYFWASSRMGIVIWYIRCSSFDGESLRE